MTKHAFGRRVRQLTLLSTCMKCLDELADLAELEVDQKFYKARYNSLKLMKEALEHELENDVR